MNTLLFLYLMFLMPLLLILRISGVIDIPYWIILAPCVVPLLAVLNLVFLLVLLELA